MAQDEMEIIMRIIIDDGNSDRVHRKTIFTPEFRNVGIAYNTHNCGNTTVVLYFSGDSEI